MMILEKHCFHIETTVLRWKIKDLLTLGLEWKLKVLLILEVCNKRNEKLFKKRFKTYLRNVETTLEME